MTPAQMRVRLFLPDRLAGFSTSLCLHVAVVFALFSLSGPARPRNQSKKEPQYQVTLVPIEQFPSRKQEKIIWYRSAEDLPRVSPGTKHSTDGPLRSVTPRHQNIATVQKKAPGNQLIWLPEPKIQLQQDIPAPNLLAFAGPAPQPEPIKRPPPRQFQPPPERKPSPQPAPTLLSEAPVVAQAALPVPAGTAALAAELRFNQPPDVAKPTPKKFVAPPSGRTTAGAMRPDLEAPPEVDRPGGGATTNAAVLTLNPVNVPGFQVPEAVKPAALSAGTGTPKGTGGGGSPKGRGLPDPGSGAVVPGVAVTGAPTSGTTVASLPPRTTSLPPPPYVPSAPPPPMLHTPTVSAPLWPHSRRLLPVVEKQFAGRIAYLTVAPPPPGINVSSDPRIWFGEREQPAPGTRMLMRPPVPVRLTNNRASSAASSGQTTIYLGASVGLDGRLTALSLLTASPLPLADLMAALDQWQFAPATRNGNPVPVDVVIELNVLVPMRAGN